jgi:MFS family permease
VISGGYLVSSGLLLLCIDVFLRNSGFRGVTTFLPIYLARLGADNSLTGTIIAVNFASQVAFMPMMGWLSDSVGRKRVLSIGMLATLIATFLLSVINNPLDVIPIELAVAFSWAAITVASNAFAADVAPPERLGEAMGVVFTSMNLGGVVGPVAAGFISDRFDLRTTFQALTFFPLLGFLFSLKLGSSGKSRKRAGEMEAAKD